MILMWSGPNMKHSQKPCRICSDISDIFSGGWLKFGHTMELLHAALGRWVSTFRRPGTSAGTKPKVPKYDGFHLCGWLHIYLWPLFVLICPHSYIYIYIHTYKYIYIYIYVYIFICMSFETQHHVRYIVIENSEMIENHIVGSIPIDWWSYPRLYRVCLFQYGNMPWHHWNHRFVNSHQVATHSCDACIDLYLINR